MVTDRDRDQVGRPKNARPRDALGRPLPRGAAGTEPLSDDLVLPPAQTLAEAQRLLDEGRAFAAHEVLEGTWKGTAPADERDLWRGLAQLAVGITHAQRGNTVGAARLLRRAADRIAPWAENPPHRIAAGAIMAWAREAADRIERQGREQLPAPPRLTA